MKKQYSKPVAELVEIQSCSIICQSLDPYSLVQSDDIFDDVPQSDELYEGPDR